MSGIPNRATGDPASRYSRRSLLRAGMIGDPDYGRAYADAIPGARFRLLEHAGHLPQIETPDALIDAVWSFADAHATSQPAR